MDGGGDGGGRCGGGGREELIETVLTCEGNISDPELPKKLTHLVHALKHVTHSGMYFYYYFYCYSLYSIQVILPLHWDVGLSNTARGKLLA